jgi:KUP system potassium uptake protein
VDFRLGFRIQPRIGLMLKKVVEEMINNKEIDIVSRYPSLHLDDIHHFRFVILESFLSYDNEFSGRDGFILNAYFSIKRLAISDKKAYGLNTNQARIEMVPLVVTPASGITLKRAAYKVHDES